MPSTSTVSPTGNSYINGVLAGVKWGVTNLTYSFPTSASFYGSPYGSGEPTNGFKPLNAQQQATVKAVLAAYSAVANVTFTQITETSTTHADLRYAESNAPSTAWAYYPSTAQEGGDVWANNSTGWYDSPIKGNYAYATFLHETGHALGLKHPHEVSGAFPAMPVDKDSLEYTVMSYRSYVGASTTTGYVNETYGFPQSLMMYDIAAVQTLYGANYNTNSSNTVYTWSPTTGEMFLNGVGQGAPGANRIFLTVWDGGGNDTYDFSNYTTGVKVNLTPGSWTTTSTAQLAQLSYDGTHPAVGNIANALLYNNDPRSLIENATGGTGNDTLTGNTANNVLVGGAGDDTLTGGAGNDTDNGGLGNDTVVFSGARSQYSVTVNLDLSVTITDLRSGSPDGTDTAIGIEFFKFSDKTYTTVDLTLTNPLPVSVDLTVNGTAGNDILTGAVGNDKLYGLGGNDTLTGLSGNDYLDGGDGNDTLDGGPGADTLIGGNGTDTVTYALSAAVYADLANAAANLGDAAGDTYTTVENLIGSAFSDSLFGTTGVNALTGGDGNDYLDGRAGNDTLSGGPGNDYLIGGAGADTLDGGAGSDTASYSTATAGVTADLTTPGNNRGDASGDRYTAIENLVGSKYADTLRGNGSNNILQGAGGNDSLDGKLGTDTAVYGGASTDYSVTKNSDGSWTVRDLRSGSPDGTDKLVSIETLTFNDTSLSLTTSGAKIAGANSPSLAVDAHDYLTSVIDDQMPAMADFLQQAHDQSSAEHWGLEGSDTNLWSAGSWSGHHLFV